MAVSRALRRLLRIRELEEEQERLKLESALGEVHRLEQAQAAAFAQNRRGRMLVAASAQSGELADRLAGIEESRTAERRSAALLPRIVDAQALAVERREQFLEKRVERRQAETLIEEAAAKDAIQADRRSQQALDDWFGNRPRKVHPIEGAGAPAETETGPSVAGCGDRSSSARKT